MGFGCPIVGATRARLLVLLCSRFVPVPFLYSTAAIGSTDVILSVRVFRYFGALGNHKWKRPANANLCVSRRRPQIFARDEVGAAEAAGAGAARAEYAAGARPHAAAPSARAQVGAA